MAPQEEAKRSFVSSIFTEKVVGLAFAIAFGSWSWNINVLTDKVDAVGATIQLELAEQKKELGLQRREIEALKLVHSADKGAATSETMALTERVGALMQRVIHLEEERARGRDRER